MSTPRDRDGFDDRPEDQRGWSEPTHLGDGPDPGRDGGTDRGWQPPGWSLPDATPDRPAPPPDWDATPPPPSAPPPGQQYPGDRSAEQGPPGPPQERRGGLLGGLFGSGRDRGPRKISDVERTFTPKGGPVTDLAAWGQAFGWTASDGTAPEDAVLLDLTRTAPVRPASSEVPSNVLRGRAQGRDMVAFDIVAPYGRGWVPTYAVTAAPVLGSVPGFRLTPARFWRHGTGGMLQIPSGDAEFDARWVLLAPEDSPQLRRLVEDPVVRQALLGSDDGDEIWSAVGFVAAVRPDGQRPPLIEHHSRILAAVSAALA